MKLGDVVRKEREKKGLAIEAVAEKLGVSAADLESLEAGETEAETWGPHLAQIAITLETPTSRLLAESGRWADTGSVKAGDLIRGHRERREKTTADLAAALGITEAEYQTVEAGDSPIETYGRLLLGFAEVIEQPVFNLFYPCGLPFQELDDYP